MSDEPVEGRRDRLVREAIGAWRDGLVNLTGSNRLLNFRPRKTSAVPVTDPGTPEVVRRLKSGAHFSFRPSAVETSDEPEPERVLPAVARGRAGVLHTDMAAKELAGALRNLLRRSHQEFLDRGLRILYLAAGTLEWTDETGASYSSPLLLLPVELQPTGPRQLPHLRMTDDDPVMNPALSLRLAQSDVVLPALTDLDDLDPEAVLRQVRSAVAGRREWQVQDTLVLSYFTFAKETMYRDLLDHEELITQHPAVVALAAGGRGEDVGDFGFDEIQDQDVDRLAPVDRTPLVLDADSSQRACIAAAVEGRSFVMDGPPGTGKSQTIANMIGALLHAGRTVLFVSEKAAALDVVRNRLAAVGLDAYLLELHSSKATRKEVAEELGRSLLTRLKAKQAMSDVDREQLRRRQDELNRYAAAMNEPRAPLNESLHAVIGRLSEMTEVPSAPRTGQPIKNLSPAVLGEIRRLADSLGRAWRPALQGSSYVWRHVRHGHAMTARLQAADRALTTLTQVLAANAPVADAFGFTGLSHADPMARLLEHHAARPRGVPDRWLTSLTVAEITEATERLTTQVDAVRERQRQLTASSGAASWTDIPSSDGLAALDLRRIASLDPAPLNVDTMTGTVMNGALDRLQSDAHQLDAARAALTNVATLLRLPQPRTFDDADKLLFVAATADEADRPEAQWLLSRPREVAHQALDHLARTCTALDAAESAARRFYTDAALEADAGALDERFRTQHSGWRRLGSAYRNDKATVAGFTRDGVSPADAHQHLRLVVEWQWAMAELNGCSQAYARDLGSYFHGRATDRDRTSRAIHRATAIAQRFPDADLQGLGEQVTTGAPTAPLLRHATASAATALSEWRARLNQVADHGPRPQLMAGSISEATAWIGEHITVMTMAQDVVGQLDDATSRTWTVADCRQILAQRQSIETALADLEADEHRHTAALGALYEGVHTNFDVLNAASSWARDLHEMADGPLTASQASALAGAVAVDSLQRAVSEWRARRNDILDAFDDTRRTELSEELDNADDARALLRELTDDTDGQQEWRSYADAAHGLRRHGLGEAVDFCAREQVMGGDLRSIVEKAVLAEWVDHHVSTDPALQPVRAQDREAAVAEFRELDRRVVATAVGSIVEVCNARRPRSVLGGPAALIQREAEKKRKHMPVRELIQRARGVVQAIKPCFMMSPLAVSQYLPADFTFDVVIFDEASQVAPMDAINCVYRGRALITAGDAKQLPPTSFFALAGDEGDEWTEDSDDSQDFESILDLAKSSGSFRSLTLKWHYRSRHESLIAFSNASFYKGQLVTFPGADHEGPDVGVELIPVHGVYRRGSSRDNPVEARKVAELVIHHFDTRPGRSVGVVTFSEAQASTIEAAVDEMRRDRPDLDEQFAESRLDGFFVKSLESVQGDERDVMIFSIGYGPDENGKIDDGVRPAQPRGWLAQAQRRDYSRALSQRDRQLDRRRRHQGRVDERRAPAPPSLSGLRRARAACTRPGHEFGWGRRVAVRGVGNPDDPRVGLRLNAPGRSGWLPDRHGGSPSRQGRRLCPGRRVRRSAIPLVTGSEGPGPPT